jgi:two-component system cell cycle sensor histidine kinase PleC
MFARASSLGGRSALLSRYTETMGELSLRQQTETALMAAKVESDLANRAKSSFLGTMSHELRTPLNAIIGFSDLIENTPKEAASPEKSAEYAAQISKAGRHMLGIISDILDMSKLESGTFQLNIDDHDLAELIEDSIPLVRQRIAGKKQTLEARLARDIPELPIDARRIRQVLVNLLSNAHKFTPEGGRILVTARGNRDGGATIAIVDSGIGMTPEQMAIALEPFGQVQSIYTRSEEGSGLGLAIARGLVRQHGGELYLESEPDVGTAVIITLRRTLNALAFAQPVNEGGGERRTPRRPTAAGKDSGA